MGFAKKIYYCAYLKRDKEQFAARAIYLWSNGIQQVKVQIYAKIGEAKEEKMFSTMKWSESNGWVDFGVNQIVEQCFLTCFKSETIDVKDWDERWERAKTNVLDFVNDFYGEVQEPENIELFDNNEKLI
jgi:hypothetical protein